MQRPLLRDSGIPEDVKGQSSNSQGKRIKRWSKGHTHWDGNQKIMENNKCWQGIGRIRTLVLC